jgi:hypothetical protein
MEYLVLHLFLELYEHLLLPVEAVARTVVEEVLPVGVAGQEDSLTLV